MIVGRIDKVPVVNSAEFAKKSIGISTSESALGEWFDLIESSLMTGVVSIRARSKRSPFLSRREVF